MPIIFIHGVNVRDAQAFEDVRPSLLDIVAPVISNDPATVPIHHVFWGNLGVNFSHGGIARPRTRLLGQGAGATPNLAQRILSQDRLSSSLGRLPTTGAAPAPTGGLSSGQATPPSLPPARLALLAPDELEAALVLWIGESMADPEQRFRLSLKATDLATDPAWRRQLAGKNSAADEIAFLRASLAPASPTPAAGGLVAAGAVGDWFTGIGERAGEALSRATSLPGYAASTLLIELTPLFADLIYTFLGDVFLYLSSRGTAASPGEIPRLLLKELQLAHQEKQARGGEPIVVLSHSMGGQIVYDTVTHFLPGIPAYRPIKVDFWCPTASQVGFFEECKLFLASNPTIRKGSLVPFPSAHLGAWWNVWDPNDVISFTTRDIFAGVDDESYDSGYSLLAAHGGYLKRPSFFRRLAEKIRTTPRV